MHLGQLKACDLLTVLALGRFCGKMNVVTDMFRVIHNGIIFCSFKYTGYVVLSCFRHLRQLRHIRRSLSTESATTLMHAFVTPG